MFAYLKLSNKIEKSTFKYHLVYTILEAVLTGIFVLNEFVFLKSLHGNSYQLGILFQFSTVVLLLAIFVNELLSRLRNKKKLLRIVALLTRLPLILLFFFPSEASAFINNSLYHYVFLSIFFIYYLATPVVLPTINLFLKNNYSHGNFGKLFGIATTAGKITLLLTTFICGLILDYDNYAFRYLYPLAGIIGLISIFIFSKIDITLISTTRKHTSKEIIHLLINKLNTTLIKNKAFRDFQIGFMFYGFAFMSTVTVITIFYQIVLDLNYSSVAFYKNAYNILAILLLPFFGKLLSSLDTRIFSIISFTSLLLYIFFLMLTAYFPYHWIVFDIKIYALLLTAVFFHAFFAATMALLWSIGSAYFCDKEEASTYQSVHLSLTGFRGLFMPIVGIVLYESFGFTITFVLAIISLLLGIIYLIFSKSKNQIPI